MKRNHSILLLELLFLFSTIHYYVIIAEKAGPETCNEDGDEPCFFDEDDYEDEDASTPVILRDVNTNTEEDYPVFEKLTRPVNIKVSIGGKILESYHNCTVCPNKTAHFE